MTQTPDSPAPPQRIECAATREPAVRSAIVAAMLLGFGVWCYADRNDPKYAAPKAWDWENLHQIPGYVFNHMGVYVMVPAGALLLLWSGLRLRRRLVADEQGIGYAGRGRIAWDQVDSLDARRLQSKGIVVLHAGDRRLVLDSYYLRDFRRLVALVERHVPSERQVLK